jgi:DNA-binding transcriptional LysR family regulator
MNTTIPNITTHQMHAVLTLQAEGTFTAASNKLGISQPGLTRMIQAIEREVGKPLFKRTSKGAELTREGTRFRYWCEGTIDGYDIWLEGDK